MPQIAIIGRQNVGKSTLFNALIGQRKSIVYDRPGVTRDLVTAHVPWGEGRWTLTDFPGFEEASALTDDELSRMAVEKAMQCLEDYHLLVWVVAREGLSPFEEKLAQRLRTMGDKVWLAVNRVDDSVHEAEAAEMYRLGFGDVFFISALNRRGIKQLRESICARFKAKAPAVLHTLPPDTLKLAIIGKPNSGKSTLFNRLTQKEKALVSDIAGTTRDTIEDLFSFQGKHVLLTDTAGMRRRRSIDDLVEKFSVERALGAVKESEVVIMLVDPYEGFDKQNKNILQLALDETKPLVMAINKSDLLQKDPERRNRLEQQIKFLQKQFWSFPVFFISSLDGKRSIKPLEEAFKLKEIAEKKVGTPELNRIFDNIKQNPIIETQRVKIHYITQAFPKRHFIVFGNRSTVTPSIERYIRNQLQKRLGWEKLPVTIEIRDKITHKKE